MFEELILLKTIHEKTNKNSNQILGVQIKYNYNEKLDTECLKVRLNNICNKDLF